MTARDDAKQSASPPLPPGPNYSQAMCPYCFLWLQAKAKRGCSDAISISVAKHITRSHPERQSLKALRAKEPCSYQRYQSSIRVFAGGRLSTIGGKAVHEGDSSSILLPTIGGGMKRSRGSAGPADGGRPKRQRSLPVEHESARFDRGSGGAVSYSDDEGKQGMHGAVASGKGREEEDAMEVEEKERRDEVEEEEVEEEEEKASLEPVIIDLAKDSSDGPDGKEWEQMNGRRARRVGRRDGRKGEHGREVVNLPSEGDRDEREERVEEADEAVHDAMGGDGSDRMEEDEDLGHDDLGLGMSGQDGIRTRLCHFLQDRKLVRAATQNMKRRFHL